jgi:protein-serine/threonine kinase
MEYMSGGDFLGLLIRENILHEAVARFYTAEMILCIEEAHRLRVIHRDIKPDNFLISASGHLKISDFGLAFDGHWSHDASYYSYHRYSLLSKLGIEVGGDEQDRKNGESLQRQLQWPQLVAGKNMDKHQWHSDGDYVCTGEAGGHATSPGRDGDLAGVIAWRNRCGIRTSANSCVGTSQYMAPEVVQGVNYDGRCDWWSVGIILYECLYGHTPFLSDEGRAQTKRNILVCDSERVRCHIRCQCH